MPMDSGGAFGMRNLIFTVVNHENSPTQSLKFLWNVFYSGISFLNRKDNHKESYIR